MIYQLGVVTIFNFSSMNTDKVLSRCFQTNFWNSQPAINILSNTTFCSIIVEGIFIDQSTSVLLKDR